MSHLIGIWQLLSRSQRRRLVALHVLAVLMAVSTVGGIAAVVPFFEVLAEPAAIRRSRVLLALYERLHFSSDASFVVALGAGFVLSVLLANTLNLFGTLAINRFALSVGNALRVRLFAGYLGRDSAFHSQTNSAVLATRVLYETGRVSGGILQHGLILAANLFTIALVLASMLLLNPLVTACAVAGLALCYALMYSLSRERLLRNGRLESRQHAERAQVTNEAFAAIKEIQILHLQRYFIARLEALCRSIGKSELSTLAISVSPRCVLECATVLCLVGVALYVRSSEGIGPWIAQLSFIGMATYRLLPALQQTFTAVAKIRSNVPALDAVAADVQQAASAAAADCSPAVIAEGKVLAFRQEVRLQAVSFRYAPGRAAALAELNLSIAAGASVGLIGANGSGKTTAADLLTGLLLPQSGRVTIDGVVLDQRTRRGWQAAIAYVPQQVFLLDASFAENIAPGVAVQHIDRRRMEEAVARARLAETVASFSDGYAERLGERGARLSGGQRQRLGIARALYRDASLLILDEATSSLDPQTEAEIVDMLDSLRPKLTLLQIAHRLGSLRHCDVIHELRDGRLVGTWSYAELRHTRREWSGVAELHA